MGLELLISRQEIEGAVEKIAQRINHDYQGRSLVIVAILKGSFIFLSDLVRRLDIPVSIEFVRLKSYKGIETTGKVKIRLGLETSIKGRDVLIVEDIVDTGITLNHLINYIRKRKPASVRVCALLDKAERRVIPIKIDYLGFTVPNRFLVGYGLDLDERYRQLPDIWAIKN